MIEEYRFDNKKRPMITLPETGLKKFVQIEFGKKSKDYLFICEEGFSEFHGDIMHRTLERFGFDFDGKWSEDKTRFIPNSTGDLYKLIDAGKIKRTKNTIEIGDSSADYDVICHGKYLDKIIPYLPNEIKFVPRIGLSCLGECCPFI